MAEFGKHKNGVLKSHSVHKSTVLRLNSGQYLPQHWGISKENPRHFLYFFFSQVHETGLLYDVHCCLDTDSQF